MRLGITGGIACGKSSAAAFLREMGWVVLDADQICHAVYKENHRGVRDAIAARWGSGVVNQDGSLSRPAVAEIVFARPEELAWLESVAHPAAAELLSNAMDGLGGASVLVEAALLFEAGWDASLDAVAAVWAPVSTARRRLVEARGMTLAEADSRLAVARMTPDAKLERSDFGLINTGCLGTLRLQCLKLNEKLRQPKEKYE